MSVVMMITVGIIWTVAVGVTVAGWYLIKEISRIEHEYVTREEFNDLARSKKRKTAKR